MVKDIFGNTIPKTKKERDAQFKKIMAMQKKAEEKRYKASLRVAKERLKLNYR